jgi:hypothetical protein
MIRMSDSCTERYHGMGRRFDLEHTIRFLKTTPALRVLPRMSLRSSKGHEVNNLRFLAHDSLHLPQLDFHMNKLQNSVAQPTQHAVFEMSDSPNSPRTSDDLRHPVGA